MNWLPLAPRVEFLLIGWTVRLIFGAAFWILPRYPGGCRGSAKLVWLSLLCLNLEILLAALAEFAVHCRGALVWAACLGTGAPWWDALVHGGINTSRFTCVYQGCAVYAYRWCLVL